MLKVPAKHTGQKMLRVVAPQNAVASWYGVQVGWFSQSATWYS